MFYLRRFLFSSEDYNADSSNSDLLSVPQVVVSLFKCVVGTGSFYLPFGMLQAGLYGGAVGLLVMCGAAIYLNWIIMDAKWKKFGPAHASYYDLCKILFGPFAGYLMYASIIISNAGSCAVYLVTMAELLTLLTDKLTSWQIQLIFLFGEMIIACLPSFKYLSWTSILGDIGLSLLFQSFWYGFAKGDIQPPSHYPGLVIPTYATFFATAAFLYIQPSTLFPIMNNMREPNRFNYVSSLTYIGIGVVNTVFAVLGYMFFGKNTKPLVLSNLVCDASCPPAEAIFFKIAQATLVVDVFFTFPIIMASVYEVLELSLFDQPWNRKKTDGDEHESLINETVGVAEVTSSMEAFPLDNPKARGVLGNSVHWKKMLTRIAVLALVGVIGILVPRIDVLLGVISGATLTFNGFIMGPLCHLKIRYDEGDTHGFGWLVSLVVHTFIILFGFVIGVWTVYLALQSF